MHRFVSTALLACLLVLWTDLPSEAALSPCIGGGSWFEYADWDPGNFAPHGTRATERLEQGSLCDSGNASWAWVGIQLPWVSSADQGLAQIGWAHVSQGYCQFYAYSKDGNFGPPNGAIHYFRCGNSSFGDTENFRVRRGDDNYLRMATCTTNFNTCVNQATTPWIVTNPPFGSSFSLYASEAADSQSDIMGTDSNRARYSSLSEDNGSSWSSHTLTQVRSGICFYHQAYGTNFDTWTDPIDHNC